ncbi:MAG: ABC transporter permease subunit [Acidimicrobiales bacterium]|nr:ABC transporter permease subunit [Acidimicrobiales bacterium]
MTAVVDAPDPPGQPPRSSRPPLWRDVRVIRVVLQVAFAVAVVALISYLYSNLVNNLTDQGIRTDFGYLDRPAGFQILGSDFRAAQSVSDALLVGLSNTVSVAVIGIVLTMILGIIVGVASLSSNWLVRKAATVYVETLRNLPPLIVIVFMFTAVILRLPRIEAPAEWFDLAIWTNRTISIAAPSLDAGSGGFLLALVTALVLAAVVWIVRTRHNARTGQPHHRVALSGLAFLAVVVLAWSLTGRPLGIDRPEVVGRQLEGGWSMSANYAAVLFALVIYTASYIAEIVRGSIQAVHKGQTEASLALALSGFQRLRFVILPQAFRIAVPAIANQFLNLTKNSSLAIAVGFAELTQVTFIVIGNGNPAPQSILLLMFAYLFLSLVIALFTNIVNRRFQLVSR